MQRDFRKEFSYLTKNHAKLFRFDVKTFFKFSSDRAFYDVINGNRKITETQEAYILEQLIYYHNLQKKIGKMYLEITN
jgi:hypothetical protein